MSFKFKKAWRGPVLSRDQGLRQGQAVKSALAMLGQSEARSFLNAHHDGLGGRPLDLAVARADGLSAVEAALGVEGQAMGGDGA